MPEGSQGSIRSFTVHEWMATRLDLLEPDIEVYAEFYAAGGEGVRADVKTAERLSLLAGISRPTFYRSRLKLMEMGLVEFSYLKRRYFVTERRTPLPVSEREVSERRPPKDEGTRSAPVAQKTPKPSAAGNNLSALMPAGRETVAESVAGYKEEDGSAFAEKGACEDAAEESCEGAARMEISDFPAAVRKIVRDFALEAERLVREKKTLEDRLMEHRDLLLSAGLNVEEILDGLEEGFARGDKEKDGEDGHGGIH